MRLSISLANSKLYKSTASKVNRENLVVDSQVSQDGPVVARTATQAARERLQLVGSNLLQVVTKPIRCSSEL